MVLHVCGIHCKKNSRTTGNAQVKDSNTKSSNVVCNQLASVDRVEDIQETRFSAGRLWFLLTTDDIAKPNSSKIDDNVLGHKPQQAAKGEEKVNDDTA